MLAARLSGSFSIAFFGNSLVAILAGEIGQYTADKLPLTQLSGSGPAENTFKPRAVKRQAVQRVHYGGYTAPFVTANLFLVLCLFLLMGTWSENYGQVGKDVDQKTDGLMGAFNLIMGQPLIALCGLVCCLFESSMFIFVFNWTPVLMEEGEPDPPFGHIFSGFMIMCMLGSRLFSMASHSFTNERIGMYVLFVAAACHASVLLTESVPVRLLAFFLFEMCVGMYFPMMGTMKGQIVPESKRATIYNIYRVPLNAIVVATLMLKLGAGVSFFITSLMLVVAAGAQARIIGMGGARPATQPAPMEEEEEEEEEEQLLMKVGKPAGEEAYMLATAGVDGVLQAGLGMLLMLFIAGTVLEVRLVLWSSPVLLFVTLSMLAMAGSMMGYLICLLCPSARFASSVAQFTLAWAIFAAPTAPVGPVVPAAGKQYWTELALPVIPAYRAFFELTAACVKGRCMALEDVTSALQHGRWAAPHALFFGADGGPEWEMNPAESLISFLGMTAVQISGGILLMILLDRRQYPALSHSGAADPEVLGPKTLLQVKGLLHSYGWLTGRRQAETLTLKGVSFKIERGEMLGLLGPNGAGKTTAIRCITGEEAPKEGSVSIGSEVPGGACIGLCPQDTVINGDLTVFENLLFFAHVRGVSGDAARRAVAEILRATRLEEKQHALPDALSGGMRRRLAVGCAMIGVPSVVILDEPTTGLDPVSRRGIWETIAEVAPGAAFVQVGPGWAMERRAGSSFALVFLTRARIMLYAPSQAPVSMNEGTSQAGGQAAAALAAAFAVPQRRRCALRAEPAEPEVVDAEGDVNLDSFSEMTPYGVYRSPPARIFEGTDEVDVSKKEERPAGSSEDNTYFWKMTQDKRFIEVIVPVDDWVEAKDVVYRIGEEPEDPSRGPTLELGFRYKDEDGRFKEHLLIDGQILNAVRREESFWILDDMVGVKVIILTLSRPRMRRQRHDPILRRKTEEERIDPQTWDALLVEDRIRPDITNKVFMDLEFEGEPAGRLEIGLFGALLPKTVENFRGLCNGQYVDQEGKEQKSAFCYKGSSFGHIMGNHIMSAGNAGLDLELIEFTPDELVDYYQFFKDFDRSPETVGKVLKGWVIRWGADLGLGEDAFGKIRKEGQATDSDSKGELKEISEIMEKLIEKGEGAKIWFYKPEWEKGCDMKGGFFPAEGFKVPHMKRGMLTMDRHETQDYQGSVFFITLKEFPQMDQRWVCFGEILSGLELLDQMEEQYEGFAEKVTIADCGDLS
ncbi:unnamed protein product [Effrenium voratum]|uniref:Molybdate-anion transporter n=1 Tax=Effrenium voratum TaxID=2562239 RepID=A0AA36JBW8_9DINO|nr:unnamed protein product [Effrenium voratum]